MKKYIYLLALLSIISCRKQSSNGLIDNRPPVPVIISNAIDYRPDPTVSTSIAGGGNIQIILSIPSTSGRTIKEITKIAASTSFTAIQSSGTTGFYISTPIAVNSTSYTFNTTLAEYVVKAPGVIPTISTTAGTELAKRFYFMVTLDDGSVIIAEPVRVLVTN